MNHSLLATLLTCIACAAAISPAQGQTNPYAGTRGESLRVAFGGSPGMQQRLADLGLGEDHAKVTTSPGWETVEVVVERFELERLRPLLPPHTLIAVLEQSRPFREIAAARRRFVDLPDTQYHTRSEVIAHLQLLEKTYPKLAKVYDLQSRYGAPPSHDGYRIYVLRMLLARLDDAHEYSRLLRHSDLIERNGSV